jgi:hypothetical protein
MVQEAGLMGYVRKLTTLFLLLVLVLSLCAFAGSVYFYQKNLKNMNGELTGRDTEIGRLNGALTSMTQNYTKLAEAYALKIERESELSGQYTDIKGVKETLEVDKVNLSSGLNNTQQQLNRALLNISALQTTISNLNLNIVTLESEAGTIKNDTIYICGKIHNKINLTVCKDYQ